MQFIEDFKIGYKDLVGRWFFPVIRWGESRLSPQALYSILKPFFYLRAVFNCTFRRQGYTSSRPDFLRVAQPARARRRQKMNDYMNQVLEFFPDRLSNEKWSQNCRVEGLEHLQSGLSNKRPTVMAFCHFGPYELIRILLRAKGIPAATLRAGKAESRRFLMRLKDKFCPLPEVPVAVYSDQLRTVDEFIAAGNLLMVVIDAPVNKQIDVPFCEGWTFQMAAGAVRLAMRYDADLLPCSITEEGRWHFCIRLGEPVPQELLLSKNDWQPAAKHLLDQMIPIFRTWPEQCRPDLIRCLKLSHEHSPSRELAFR